MTAAAFGERLLAEVEQENLAEVIAVYSPDITDTDANQDYSYCARLE